MRGPGRRPAHVLPRVQHARARLRRLRADESGAAAVTVAILSILLIAVLALVVDYGMLQAKNSELQVAADAAALAIADDCARGMTTLCTSSGPGLQLAYANDADAASATLSAASRTVTVTATAEVPFSLIGSFGLADTILHRRATAEWTAPVAGGPASAARVFRFAVASCRVPSSLPAAGDLRGGRDCQSGLFRDDFMYLGPSCDRMTLRVGDAVSPGIGPIGRGCDFPRDRPIVVPLWERVCTFRIIVCLSWEEQVTSFALFQPRDDRYNASSSSISGTFLRWDPSHPDIVEGGGVASPGSARLID